MRRFIRQKHRHQLETSILMTSPMCDVTASVILSPHMLKSSVSNYENRMTKDNCYSTSDNADDNPPQKVHQIPKSYPADSTPEKKKKKTVSPPPPPPLAHS